MSRERCLSFRAISLVMVLMARKPPVPRVDKMSHVPHLLLIDDDIDLIPEQVRRAFPAPEFQVDLADTGAAGLERLRSNSPDVILLDLRLPDQSGLDVYKQIRAFDARIPVVFVTLTKT